MSFFATKSEWKKVRLGDVAKTASGGTPKRGVSSYYGGGIPWVKSGELGDSTVYETSETITQAGLDGSSAKLFPKGTLCVALYGATVGKLGVLGVDAATNQAVCGIFLPKEIDTRFVYRFLESKRRDLIEMGKGGAQPNISQEIVRDIEIPLPPLPEQKRIVAEIEKQFTRLEAGIGALKRVQANLKRYRATVLKTACEGKLVSTEFELSKIGNRKSKFENGEQLLKRILAEHREKWSGKGKYKEPAESNGTTFKQIPEGWAIVNLCLVAECIDPHPSHRTPPEVLGGVPYIGMGNITESNNLDRENARRVSPEILKEHRIRYKIGQNDFIIGKIGTIGKPVKLTEPYDYALSANVVLIQPKTEYVYPGYLFAYLASPVAERLLTQGSRATTQAAFGIKRVREIPVPLPPFFEQKRIVAEVERRLSVVEELETLVSTNLQRATRLRQSILQKAFSGNVRSGKNVDVSKSCKSV